MVTNGFKQTLNVYNVLGALVNTTIIESEKTEIDLSNQPAGIYFIKTDSGTIKIIKE